MEIKEKVAVVTGAGRGIGRRIALDLAAKGARLAICARTAENVRKVAGEAEALGAECLPVEADLSTLEGVRRLADAALSRFGTADILVNDAGMMVGDGIAGVTESDWDKTFALNVKAAMFLSQALLPYMERARCGYIVNICSTVALRAKPEVTSYSASKYALMGLSEALYKEGRRRGVRVSSVYPGVTDTPLLRAAADKPCPPELWMQPEDIARCVLFLLESPERMVVKDIVPWSTGFDEI